MRVIAKKALREHWERPGRADSQGPLEAWHTEARAATWTSFADVKRTYGSASNVGNQRIVFNVGGNKYRLVVRISYQAGIIFVRFVGTHAEYDLIKVDTI